MSVVQEVIPVNEALCHSCGSFYTLVKAIYPGLMIEDHGAVILCPWSTGLVLVLCQPNHNDAATVAIRVSHSLVMCITLCLSLGYMLYSMSSFWDVFLGNNHLQCVI